MLRVNGRIAPDDVEIVLRRDPHQEVGAMAIDLEEVSGVARGAVGLLALS